MLTQLKKTVYTTISKYFSNAVLKEGVLKGTGQPFRCLFVDNSLYNEYVSSAIYEGTPRILDKRKIWIRTLKRMVNNPEPGWDLCIAAIHSSYEREFEGLYDFKSRKLVRQIVDTSGSWEDIRGRFHTRMKRFSNSMAKSPFNWRTSREATDFDFFYHRMYVPHAVKQFGKLSLIDSYEKLKQEFLKGFIVFVLNNSLPVAAALCQTEGRSVIYRNAGVLDGDDEHVKDGAQMAFYYYLLKYAKENNLAQLDLMSCSPFFNDGVFRHKRGWGAAVFPQEAVAWVYFFIPRNFEKAVSFFEHNPAIVYTEKGLKGLTGLTDPTVLPGIKKELHHQFYNPGLEGLMLLTPNAREPIDMAWKDLQAVSHLSAPQSYLPHPDHKGEGSNIPSPSKRGVWGWSKEYAT